MSKYLNLYAFCKIVMGKENIIICDLQKKNLKYIPNTLAEIINLLKKEEYKKVAEQFSDQKVIFNSYINFLISEKFAFFSDHRDAFAEIKNEFETPEIINNSIIEYDFKNYDLNKLLRDLDNLYTKYLEIRLLSYSTVNLDYLVNVFNSCNSCGFRSITIYIPFIDNSQSLIIYNKLKKFGKIYKIVFYNSTKRKINVQSKNIQYIKDNIEDIRNTNFNTKNLIIDLKYFFEAQEKNPYYNKKVSIDSNGDIKNCLKNTLTFGNISQDNLSEIICTDNFQEFWNVSHDQIINIKNDEMRYNKIISNDLKKVSDNLYEIIL